MASFKKISTTIALIIILVLPPPQRYHSKSHLCVGQWTMYLPPLFGEDPARTIAFLNEWMNGRVPSSTVNPLPTCYHYQLLYNPEEEEAERRRQCCISAITDQPAIKIIFCLFSFRIGTTRATAL